VKLVLGIVCFYYANPAQPAISMLRYHQTTTDAGEFIQLLLARHLHYRAYEWIMSNGGLATEEDYGSYKAVDFMCQSRNVTPTVKVASYVNVTMYDQEALKVAMFNHGPIAVDIDASHL